MKTLLKLLCAVMPVTGLFAPNAFAASTPGGAHLTATINDLAARSGSSHYVVVWVTKADNTFITTLWKQGASSFAAGNWTQHFPTWETQRGSSTALPAPPDGYSSATATSYAATDPSPPTAGLASNPINITWNGKDASGVVVPDGDYKFWIEYAENTGTHGTDTGGLTTGGLTFTKGPTSSTVNPPNQGAVGNPSGGFNFSSMSIVWTPAVVTVPPTITSAAPPATGTVGTPYSFQVTATGTPTPSFTASALPTGLTISAAGLISGTPTVANTFTGTITAANGVNPDATQAFSIVISAAPVAPTITSAAPPATGTVGTPYSFQVTATGTPTPSFTASGLPTGLTISAAGLISGTPTVANTFTGTITAANGVNPDATQAFSIVISDVPPVTIVSVRTEGSNLMLTGTGPANATYEVLTSTDLALPSTQWTSAGTGSFDSSGNFSFTVPMSAGVPQSFTKLRVP